MSFVKLVTLLCRGVGWVLFCGCVFFAASLLLQGVAQTEGEGLAKQPETAEELRARLRIALALLSVRLVGSVVFQATGVLQGRWKGAWRVRVRKAMFAGLVCWGGTCLFLCVLIFAGSFQARWDVDRAYYWLAGGAGVLALGLLGAAGLFADENRGQGGESGGAAER